MGRIHFCRQPEISTKSCKARGGDLRVHYKNTHETARAIAGMTLKRAVRFLKVRAPWSSSSCPSTCRRSSTRRR